MDAKPPKEEDPDYILGAQLGTRKLNTNREAEKGNDGNTRGKEENLL